MDQALGDFFQSILNTMAGLFQVATGQKQAQVSIAPPSFFTNGAANVSTSVAGVAGAVSLIPSTRLTKLHLTMLAMSPVHLTVV